MYQQLVSLTGCFYGPLLVASKNSDEHHLGYSTFVIPEEFAEDLETGRIHYVTLTRNGKEIGVKYRITKVD